MKPKLRTGYEFLKDIQMSEDNKEMVKINNVWFADGLWRTVQITNVWTPEMSTGFCASGKMRFLDKSGKRLTLDVAVSLDGVNGIGWTFRGVPMQQTKHYATWMNRVSEIRAKEKARKGRE